MLLLLNIIFAGVSIGACAPDFTLQGYGESATGGANNNVTTVTTLDAFSKAVTATGAATIHVSGHISASTTGAEIKVTSDKTIIGDGSTAFLDGIGLHLKSVNNVVIRNIKFTLSNIDIKNNKVNDGDTLRIEDSTNIWIDHNEFYAIDPAVQTDKDLFDGLVDITHNSDHITVSYNYFHDHWKSNLIGSSDSDNHDRKITFHHNYWKNINSRAPSFRFGSGHIYNNYYQDIKDSAIHSRMGACLLVEHNVFENSKSPLEAHADSKTDGSFQINDNSYASTDTGLAPPTTSNCTLSVGYIYTLESTSTVKATVTQYAGIGKI